MAMEQLRVRTAEGFRERLRGLMFTAQLPHDQGLLITRCACVHTCFMRYPIDLVFLDARGVVTGLRHALAPWRVSAGPSGTVDTLELAAGSVARLGIKLGECVDLRTLRDPA